VWAHKKKELEHELWLARTVEARARGALLASQNVQLVLATAGMDAAQRRDYLVTQSRNADGAVKAFEEKILTLFASDPSKLPWAWAHLSMLEARAATLTSRLLPTTDADTSARLDQIYDQLNGDWFEVGLGTPATLSPSATSNGTGSVPEGR